LVQHGIQNAVAIEGAERVNTLTKEQVADGGPTVEVVVGSDGRKVAEDVVDL
jgi:hypothetical protein